VSRYQKGKTSLDFTEARDSEWQWHQQTDNHASTPPLSFLQAGCPSCRPTNSVKALKAIIYATVLNKYHLAFKIVLKSLSPALFKGHFPGKHGTELVPP